MPIHEATKPMRIIIHDYAGHAFPTALSRGLAGRGHQVAHLHADNLQTPRGDLQRKGGDPPALRFQEIPMDPDYPRLKYSFLRRRGMEIRYGHQVAAFIRQWRPDAVLSGNTPTETQESILRATLACGANFHHWVQDFYSLAVDRLLRAKIPLVGAIIGRHYRRIERRQFARSSGLVVITGDFTPILQQEFGVAPERVTVIPNWALIDDIPVLPKDNPWSRKHDLHDKFVFLYAGTLGMKHNPDVLLQLARQFAPQPQVRVVVASEGIGAEWLRKECAALRIDNMLLLPYQQFADLAPMLATGDVLTGILDESAGVFSVPSKTLSYLCAARPLLMAMPANNMAARIVTRHGAGRVVAPGDTAAFLSAASTLFERPEIRRDLAEKGRAYAERTFATGPVTDAFERILTQSR